MPAEWHFFATSHGKGPCDGVGGTVKRLAARASLQRPINNQITTPRQLFEFAESEIKSIDIDRDARSPRLFFRCYNKTGEDCTSTWRASQRHQLCIHNWLCHCSLWWFLVGDMCCWNFPRIRRNWSKFFASAWTFTIVQISVSKRCISHELQRCSDNNKPYNSNRTYICIGSGGIGSCYKSSSWSQEKNLTKIQQR